MDLSDNERIALLNTLSGLYIQSLRMYDLLIVIAEQLGADDDLIQGILARHREGVVLSPDPALRIDDETLESRS